jgi:hypothetical protein
MPTIIPPELSSDGLKIQVLIEELRKVRVLLDKDSIFIS